MDALDFSPGGEATADDLAVVRDAAEAMGGCYETEPVTPPGVYAALFLVKGYLKESAVFTVTFDSVPPDANVTVD